MYMKEVNLFYSLTVLSHNLVCLSLLRAVVAIFQKTISWLSSLMMEHKEHWEWR